MLEGKRNLRILAFSDLHGSGFEEASSLIDHHLPDWIITCGDMLGDFTHRPANHRH